jgi:predicted O-methyltransferase YrrM
MADFYNISEFIKSYDNEAPCGLWNLRREAERNGVPIIREEMENFIRVMLNLKKPKRILELGTAIGYSAIYMAMNMPKDCHIDTIENYDKRIVSAKANIKAYGMEDRITLYEGDCAEVLLTLKDKYDFIFMDAAKAQYMTYLKLCMKLMKPGAMRLTDNIVCDMCILQSKFVVERRDRTIHERMREYLHALTHSDELDTSLIPLGDGVALSIRKD